MAELVQLQKQIEAFDRAGVGILAVGMESPEDAAKTRAEAGVSFPVLSDVEGGLVDHLDLRDVGGNAMLGRDVAQSASVFVDSSGKVLKILSAENYRVRPRVEVLLEAVAGMK